MAYYGQTHLRELLAVRRLKRQRTPLAFIKSRMSPRARSEMDGHGPRSPRRRPASVVTRPGRHGSGSGERRQQIIESASELFLKKGLDGTTVEDITQALGIGRSTFYLHFHDKRHVFLECIDSMLASIFAGEVWDEIRQEEDTRLRLRKRARLTLQVGRDFFTILDLLRSYSRRGDFQLEDKAREIYSRVLAPAKQDIERGIRKGVFRPIDPHLLSYILLGIIEAASLAMAHGEGYSEEQALAALDDILTWGLLRAPA